MAARGSKAQLARIITEYHTRLMYKVALSRGALFFDRRAQRAFLEAQLSTLSIAELRPMARHAELVMGNQLKAGAPAKPLTEQDLEFLSAVFVRLSRSARCETHVASSREKSAQVLSKSVFAISAKSRTHSWRNTSRVDTLNGAYPISSTD